MIQVFESKLTILEPFQFGSKISSMWRILLNFFFQQLLTRFNVFVEQPNNDIHLNIDRNIQDQQINITLDAW